MKKSCILIVLLLVGIFASNCYAQFNPKYGDLNGDGRINTTDSSLAERHLLGQSKLTGSKLIYGDLNGDNKINTTDVSLLNRYVLSTISIFPVDETYDSYTPSKDQIKLSYDAANSNMIVKITFPNSGFRIVDEGKINIPISGVVNPDGSTSIIKSNSRIVSGVEIEQDMKNMYTQVLTEKTINYKVDNEYFKFDFLGVTYVNNPIVTWESYVPTSEQIKISYDKTTAMMNVDITFPNEGYRVVDKGSLAVAAMIDPNTKETSYSYIVSGVKIEKQIGGDYGVKQKIETLSYQVSKGTSSSNRFNFLGSAISY